MPCDEVQEEEGLLLAAPSLAAGGRGGGGGGRGGGGGGLAALLARAGVHAVVWHLVPPPVAAAKGVFVLLECPEQAGLEEAPMDWILVRLDGAATGPKLARLRDLEAVARAVGVVWVLRPYDSQAEAEA
jgi:hypothetical protein